MRVHRSADYLRAPWRNGLGTTLEVIRVWDLATSETLWRLSIADVDQDCAFSAFAGYSRVASVVDGDGMVLTVDGHRSPELRRYDVYPFDGDAQTWCELLDGVVRVLNLMYLASSVSARMRWVRCPDTLQITTSAETALIFNAGHSVAIGLTGERTRHLGHQDCLRVQSPAPQVTLNLESSGGADLVIIEVSAVESTQQPALATETDR